MTTMLHLVGDAATDVPLRVFQSTRLQVGEYLRLGAQRYRVHAVETHTDPTPVVHAWVQESP